MANINVGLGTSNDPSYTGAVQPASRYDFNNSTKYDLLFSDLASTIKNGVEGAKSVVTNMIKEDVRYGYDKITGAQGGDLAAENPLTPLGIGKSKVGVSLAQGPSAEGPGGGTGGGATPSPMDANKPPEVQQDSFKSQVQRLQAAYSQGKIGETYYMTQLEAMNRSIRAKYPGFRDEVDAMVQNITGVTPANSLRKAIEHDLNAAQTQSDAMNKMRIEFIKSNLGYLGPEVMKREAEGKPYSMAELMTMVQPQKIAEQNMSLVKAQLEVKKAQGNAKSEDALAVANEVIGSMDQKLMNSTSKNGISINGWLSERLNELKENKTLTPEKEAQLKAEFLQMKTGYFNALNEMFNQPLQPGSKHTLASAIADPGKQKQLTDLAMEKFNNIEASLTNKDYGLLYQTANTINSINNSDAKRLMEKYDTVRAVSAIAKMPGMANVLQNVMTSKPELYSDLQNQLSSAISIHNLTGGVHQPKGATSTVDDLNTFASAPGGRTPAGMNRFLMDRANEVSNLAIPADMRLNAAKKLFSPENSKFIFKFTDPDSKLKMFNYLTSPQVTQSMQELGKKEPALWDNYSRWSMGSFALAFREKMNDVNNVNYREWIGIKWNEKANKYEVYPTDKGQEELAKAPNGAGGVAIRWLEQRKNFNVENAVNSVNAGIQQISPILKANGFNPAEEIPKLTRGIMIKDQKQHGIWNDLVNAASVKPGQEMFGTEGFGGTPLNFTQPSSKDAGGRGFSTEKSMASELKTGSADVENLNKGAQKMLDGLINEGVVDKLEVKSGFRDVERNRDAGGAKYSKHLEGGAIDLSIKGYSDEEKTALLETAIRHGAKGIGVYPGGTSLHIDTRESPMTWGYSPFGKYRKAHWSEQPRWAQGPLKKLFGE